MRVPDFFIVGSPKTGTTSLHGMLRRHPQIFMPKLKEPRFLASDMRPRERYADGPRELGYPKTLEEYLALYDGAAPEQRAGEATTTYLWSRDAAERIAALAPEARIIAMLREPASFLRSLHLAFLKGNNESERDLKKAMALEAPRREGKRIPRRSHRPQLLQYSEHVRYVEQLRRYRDRFGAEQMLVLIYDDFRRDNEATVRKVLGFLEVDDQRAIDAVQMNVTDGTVRSQQAGHLLLSLSRGSNPLVRSTKATVKTLSTLRTRHRAVRMIGRLSSGAEVPPPDESFMLELRQRFGPEVQALSEYLGRDLVSEWGYDKLG